MQSKSYSVLVTALFSLFIGGLLLAFLISPKRAVSETENRSLAQAPAFSAEAVLSGEYMKKLETYIADQFPWRDAWITLKSGSEYLLGLREFNGVYLCGDRLIAKVAQPDETLLERNLKAVETFAQNADVPVYLALIPTAAEMWKDRLPRGAESFSQDALLARVRENSSAQIVDVAGQLSSHAQEDIFYRTDHHWTSLGAYYGYCALMDAMGREAAPLERYTAETVSRSFNGTLYSSSGIRWLQPDSIQTYVPEDGLKVTSYFDGTPSRGSLYVKSYLEKKDKYSMFLGGNQPLCTIENPAAAGGSLLVIRDSYMDSEVPFLSQTFSSICLLDLRYYHGSVQQLLGEYDAVLLSYGVANFISDNNLVFLNQ